MMMKCISREEGIELLQDIHGRVCGSHSSYRTIVNKTFWHGFYWPTTKYDAIEVVRKCNDYHFFQRQTFKHDGPLPTIDFS
jgi:hypothetical protein